MMWSRVVATARSPSDVRGGLRDAQHPTAPEPDSDTTGYRLPADATMRGRHTMATAQAVQTGQAAREWNVPKAGTRRVVFACWMAILAEGYDVGVLGAVLP